MALPPSGIADGDDLSPPCTERSAGDGGDSAQAGAGDPPGAGDDNLQDGQAVSAACAVAPGMVAYCRYAWASPGTRDQLLAKSASQLVQILAEVVAAEGPIHRDELGRVIAAGDSPQVELATRTVPYRPMRVSYVAKLQLIPATC
jgi:hypothetical protein